MGQPIVYVLPVENNMKRTKQWWAKLDKDERARLVWLEKYSNHYYSNDGYLPDDCSECSGCGDPCMGSGLCIHCLNEIQRIVDKANG